jgi:hypothetical protein
MFHWRRLWLYLWVAPGSCVGLMAAALAVWRGGRLQIVDGVLEVASEDVTRWIGRLTRVGGPLAAITLGHVVVGASLADLQRTRQHERIHVRQYERWGPFFIPAYLIASGWVWLVGGHPYLDNPFEVEAFTESARAGSEGEHHAADGE